MKLAKQITINAADQTFTVDGEPFPWYVLEGGLSWDSAQPLGTVTVTMFAARIDILDEIKAHERTD